MPSIVSCFLLVFVFGSLPVLAHDGPDPITRLRCDESSVRTQDNSSTLKARLGPDGKILRKFQILQEQQTSCLFLRGGECGVQLAENYTDATKFLPGEAMTVAAWVSVDRPLQWGGLLGVI